MAAGTVTLSYSTTSNGATSATVRVTMTYYGNGETWNGSPSANNCWIKLNGTTKYFTHSYTTSSSAQSMGYADFTITKTHATQSFTATGGITGYSTVYGNPTGSCSVSVSPKTSYTITYNRNGRGTLSKSTDTKWYGETLTLASAPSTPGTGWSFQGWSTSASATSGATTYSTNGANTLYAIWKKTITLSYNANDGSNAPAAQSNTIYNSTSTTSFSISTDEPTRSNYNFTGWNTQADGGGISYAKGSTISNVSSDTILYAQWQVAYNAPTFVNNPVAWRTDDAGTQNTGAGSYAKVRFSWTKASDATGTLGTTATVEWKLSTAADSTYTTVASNISTTTYESPTRFGGSFDADTQYTIRVSLITTGHDTIYAYTFISTESFVIDVNENGTGIGFLTSAPTAGINVGSAINGLGTAGKTASGVGGIAVGARASSYTITSNGSGAIASGYAASANISATKAGSFAGGYTTGAGDIIASGNSAFAFGQGNGTKPLTASGNGAIAMGLGCTASGTFALAHNMYTTAAKRAQTTIGTWNIEDNNSSTHPAGTGGSGVTAYGKYAFIIGNGKSDSARSNAFAVNWDGTIEMNNVPMMDYVVEHGTSGYWTYEKWNSGICKAWYFESLNVQPSFVQIATGIYSNDEWASKSVSLPSGLFTVVTYANANITSNTYVHSGVPTYNNTVIVVRLWMDLATSPKLSGLGIEAIGKWK